MERIENVMHGVKGSYTGAHKSFRNITAYERKFLKRIAINLSPTKDNEINIFNSDV